MLCDFVSLQSALILTFFFVNHKTMDNQPIIEVPHGITKAQKESVDYKKWRLVLISDTHNLHPHVRRKCEKKKT